MAKIIFIIEWIAWPVLTIAPGRTHMDSMRILFMRLWPYCFLVHQKPVWGDNWFIIIFQDEHHFLVGRVAVTYNDSHYYIGRSDKLYSIYCCLTLPLNWCVCGVDVEYCPHLAVSYDDCCWCRGCFEWCEMPECCTVYSDRKGAERYWVYILFYDLLGLLCPVFFVFEYTTRCKQTGGCN